MVCSKCGARVFVAVHELGAAQTPLILDSEPDPGGSFWLLGDGRARAVANEQEPSGFERYFPHAQTCGTRVSS